MDKPCLVMIPPYVSEKDWYKSVIWSPEFSVWLTNTNFCHYFFIISYDFLMINSVKKLSDTHMNMLKSSIFPKSGKRLNLSVLHLTHPCLFPAICLPPFLKQDLVFCTWWCLTHHAPLFVGVKTRDLLRWCWQMCLQISPLKYLL